jgi:hypothetical protein
MPSIVASKYEIRDTKLKVEIGLGALHPIERRERAAPTRLIGREVSRGSETVQRLQPFFDRLAFGLPTKIAPQASNRAYRGTKQSV